MRTGEISKPVSGITISNLSSLVQIRFVLLSQRSSVPVPCDGGCGTQGVVGLVVEGAIDGNGQGYSGEAHK